MKTPRPFRALSLLLLAGTVLSLAGCLTGCEFIKSDENKVRDAVAKFASAVHGEHWQTATKLCDAKTMTWTYYSGSKVYTLQGTQALNGFFDAVKQLSNRDGFYIDITTLKAGSTKAHISGGLRFPICYNRTTLTFGKVQVPCQVTLVKLKSGRWVISSIVEASERQQG